MNKENENFKLGENSTSNTADVSSSLYEFTMTNKNGKVTKSTIPCDDWLHANRVKTELLKSKNLIKVDFVGV